MRKGKELLLATKPYAQEIRWRSWFHLWTTLALFVAMIAVAGQGALPWWLRLPASVVAGLSFVRLFIIYHDYQHRAILRKSPISAALMWTYGILSVNPPSIWNRSHDHHHHNNAKIFGASIGSFPVMTTSAWKRASRRQRFAYAASRHPLAILLGYFTVFIYGMAYRSFRADPRQHWDSAVAIVVHFTIVALVGAFFGVETLIYTVLLPSALSAAMGSYLFYAQHNYPSVKLQKRAEWDFVAAALASSSFIRMSPVMHYFTGNIGYHHVHHLNHRIPFYRLPEIMRDMPELQSPGVTSLWPWDIYRCLSLKLWDPQRDRLVTFAEARQRAVRRGNQPTTPAGNATPIAD